MVAPILDHAFFKQAVFEQDIGKRLFEVTHLASQILNLAGCRLAFGVTRQALLTGLEELLRPFVVEALRDPLAPAQLGDRILAAQSFKDNADLVFRAVALRVWRRISRTCCSADDCGPDFDLIFAP